VGLLVPVGRVALVRECDPLFVHRLFALLLWVALAVASLRRDLFSSKFHGLLAVAVVDMRTGCG
jgi:hypothetical protein